MLEAKNLYRKFLSNILRKHLDYIIFDTDPCNFNAHNYTSVHEQ